MENGYNSPGMGIMKAYQPIVGMIAAGVCPRAMLDLPSGLGWLREQIKSDVEIDGIDLFEQKLAG